MGEAVIGFTNGLSTGLRLPSQNRTESAVVKQKTSWKINSFIREQEAVALTKFRGPKWDKNILM